MSTSDDPPGGRTGCELVVTSRAGAGKLLCSPRRRAGFAYLVSIGGAQQRQPAGYLRVATRLRLVFEDALSEREGGPSADDIERLIRFARQVDPAKGKVLVHCQAGISRSTAAAIILMAVRLGPGHEDEAVAHVFAICPEARPNRRMLELADAALETGGALGAAVDRSAR
jgi:predicted protein tyrosine phosphatase